MLQLWEIPLSGSRSLLRKLSVNSDPETDSRLLQAAILLHTLVFATLEVFDTFAHVLCKVNSLLQWLVYSTLQTNTKVPPPSFVWPDCSYFANVKVCSNPDSVSCTSEPRFSRTRWCCHRSRLFHVFHWKVAFGLRVGQNRFGDFAYGLAEIRSASPSTTCWRSCGPGYRCPARSKHCHLVLGFL